MFGGDVVWPYRKVEKKKKSVLFFFILNKNFSTHLSPILNTQEPASFAVAGLESDCGCLLGAQPNKAPCCQGHRNCSSWAGVGEPENYPGWPEIWQPAWKASMISKCPELRGQPRKQPDLAALGHPGDLFWRSANL